MSHTPTPWAALLRGTKTVNRTGAAAGSRFADKKVAAAMEEEDEGDALSASCALHLEIIACANVFLS